MFQWEFDRGSLQTLGFRYVYNQHENGVGGRWTGQILIDSFQEK